MHVFPWLIRTLVVLNNLYHTLPQERGFFDFGDGILKLRSSQVHPCLWAIFQGHRSGYPQECAWNHGYPCRIIRVITDICAHPRISWKHCLWNHEYICHIILAIRDNLIDHPIDIDAVLHANERPRTARPELFPPQILFLLFFPMKF